MMHNKTMIGTSLSRSWFSNAVGGAWKLVKIGMDVSSGVNSPLHAELVALTTPHLAILVHKREKHFESLELAGERRWTSELYQFVTRVILPQLDEDPALQGRSTESLLESVDAIVASEQHRKSAEAPAGIPQTSRFDTSWAI